MVTLALKAMIARLPILIFYFRILIDRLLYKLMTTCTPDDLSYVSVSKMSEAYLEHVQAFKMVLYAEKVSCINLLKSSILNA